MSREVDSMVLTSGLIGTALGFVFLWLAPIVRAWHPITPLEQAGLSLLGTAAVIAFIGWGVTRRS